MSTLLSTLLKRGDTAARVLIAAGAYYGAVDSFRKNEEPEDEPMVERTVALLDNRSRNYSVSEEVAGFYAKGGGSDDDTLEGAQLNNILRWRASEGEGVRKRNLVRCRGGAAELHANYEFLDTLGAGAFGSVRRALDRTTGFPRAVKTVRTGHHENVSRAVEWERMLTEVEALMDLTHPNIVRLHEYYRDDDALYLVEEFCSGGTLESRLAERGGRLDANEGALMLRQMLRGVVCCHAHGLAHRDLKPDNFCLASRDAAAALKLIDFGLSLNETWSHVPSKYAHMAGTLEHSAPETFAVCDEEGRLQRPKYGQAADVWSLGAIFFQLLVGEPLINLDRERSSSADFARMLKGVVGGRTHDIVDDAAAKVRSVSFIGSRLALARRRAPEDACELLEAMLHQDPQHRITAVNALRHRFLADRPLTYEHLVINPPKMRLEAPAQAAYELPRWQRAATAAGGGDGGIGGAAVVSPLDEEMIRKLRRFAGAPALHRLAVLVEASIVGPQDDEAIMRQVLAFRLADRGGLGVLTAADIEEAMKSQGLEVPSDLSTICQCIDIGQEGSINLIEFVAATMEPRLYCEPRLSRAAFRVLDADADGAITQSDLEMMLIESPQRAARAAAILQSARPDERGRVDFKRFCEVMVPKGTDPGLAEAIANYMAKSFV